MASAPETTQLLIYLSVKWKEILECPASPTGWSIQFQAGMRTGGIFLKGHTLLVSQSYTSQRELFELDFSHVPLSLVVLKWVT